MPHPSTVGWKVAPSMDGERFYVVRQDGNTIRSHPIPFDTRREAQRGADRLNARDEKRAS